LEAFVRGVDFTAPGRQQSLGRDCLAHAVQGILDDTLAGQKSPDGTPLAANRGVYGERKAKAGLPVGIGLRGKKKAGDRMLSEVEVRGEQDITPDTASMKYGRSDAARKKGQWFTAGGTATAGCEPSGTKGQPPRPFYGLSTGTVANIMAECRDFVRNLIRSTFGGP